MALSANSPLKEAVGVKDGGPVAASTTIYEGAMLGDTAGYLRGLTAGDIFRGHATEKRDNSDGDAGDLNVQHLTGRYRLEATLAGAITDVGRKVYASDDGTLTFTAAGNTRVGKVIRYINSTTMMVEFETALADSHARDTSIIDFFDDFFTYDPTATVGGYAVVEDAGAGGGDVISDAAGGVLSVGCDGDDNDECYVSSIAEIFKFQTNKNLEFECKIKLTEANTDDANWIIGLSDTVAANSLLDDGAGPMASYDGAVFFKVDGTMKIQFESSNAGTQVTNATLADFVSGTDYVLGFKYNCGDGTTGTITPYVNGVAGTAHSITIAGLEEMHVLMGVKAGGANEEALLVDYVSVQAER